MAEATTSTPQAKTTDAASSGQRILPVQNQAMQIGKRSVGIFLQPKLTVCAPDDQYEREADAVADTLMGMPEQSFVQRKHAGSSNTQTGSIAPSAGIFIQRQPSTPSTSTQQLTIPTVTVSTPRYRPEGIISRQEFDTYVRTNYGVADVHTGTQTEQEQRITRHGVPAPSLPNWQSWNPGTASEDYTSIIDGVEEMINRLGAIPQVNTIIFFKVEYEPDTTTGIGIPHPDTGASFGAGEMVIYEAFTGSTRPAIGISSAQGTPTRQRGRSSDISYNIIHELGHGVGEAGSNNSPQMFQQYNAAVGWIGSPPVLYDVGQPEVRAAIANSTPLPAQHIITPGRWSDPTVSEQPMSRYAVVAGPSEDFAETIAAYVTNPSALQQRSPWRYNFIHTNMASWTPRMRSMTPGAFRPPVGDFPMPSGDTRFA